MFPVIWSLCVVTSVGSPGHLIWPRVIFFLWGYLKAKVYACCPGTIEQLKEAIQQEVTAIPPAMTRKAMENFHERLQECVINNGHHLSDVIFKTVWKKIASNVLFINKRIFCVPCFVWFLLLFKMRELFLPHPVYHVAASVNKETETTLLKHVCQKSNSASWALISTKTNRRYYIQTLQNKLHFLTHS